MATHYTRSKAQRPSTVEDSDVEPSDVAAVAATVSSSSPSEFVGLSVAAVGGPESMAVESAEPVSTPIHPYPAGRPSFQGGLGVSGPAGSSRVGVSLKYPSGLAGPSELSVCGDEQMSTSSIAAGTGTPPLGWRRGVVVSGVRQ